MALAGGISSFVYWYEGLARWVTLGTVPPSPALATGLHLSVGWTNSGTARAKGHIELTIIRPDGATVKPAAVSGQDTEREAGYGWTVQFAPVTLDLAGQYSARAVLSMEEYQYPEI